MCNAIIQLIHKLFVEKKSEIISFHICFKALQQMATDFSFFEFYIFTFIYFFALVLLKIK